MKTVIFDFDGTIADSFKLIVEILEELTGRHSSFTEDEINILKDEKPKQILKQLHIKSWRVPILLYKGRKNMRNKIDQVSPFEGISQQLTALEHNYSLLILSTNSRDNIEHFLKVHNLAHYFKKIYGGVGIFSKAAALQRLIKKEGLLKEEVIYVGDEIRDIEAARKAGITCVSVSWGFSSHKALAAENPTHLVDSMGKLSETIKSI